MRIKPEEHLRGKIIILYVLQHFSVPLTKDQLTEFILNQELLNLFDLQKFLDELIEDEMIEMSESQEKMYVLLLDNGYKALEALETEIAKPIRQMINDAIAEYKKVITTKNTIMCEYYKCDENDYNVNLSIKEFSFELMNITLNVMTNKDAKAICDNWHDKAQYLYGDILKTLLSNHEEPHE